MRSDRGRWLAWTLVLCFPWQAGQVAAQPPENLFANPSFERGREGWRVDKGGSTEANFTVDDKDAAAEQYSALVNLGSVAEWGTQFGQSFKAGAAGKTYTFAVSAKAVGKPATVTLQIERSAKPWDRAVASDEFTLPTDHWTELHVTFKVEKPFPQGWFAYLSCTQPKASYRADMFRLYEGPYVHYQEAVRQQNEAASVRLFDTGASSPAPLSGDALSKKTGWKQLPEDETAHTFRGDAVVANNRLAVVLRRGGPGAEVYAAGEGAPVLRAVLAPADGGGQPKLASVTIVENTPADVAVEAAFEAGGETLRVHYTLSLGQAFIKTEARPGVQALRVEAPCRFAVLPDFFADDIVVDAVQLPADSAELPSENFLLQMSPDCQAIVMSVFTARQQDARVALSGSEEQRMIRHSEIRYGEGGKIWVAVLAARDIWHRHDVARKDENKVLPLGWHAPFPAQWRVDWRRDDGLVGSWEMLIQDRDGEFTKHGWFGEPARVPADRKRWTTVYGSVLYPCWIDRDGQGCFQPLARRREPGFEGPALVYPINRVHETPLDRFTVVDMVRATLGVGPCEYILDVEGQGTAYKGRATCATRDALKDIYTKGQQKQKRAEIEQILADVVTFVKHIRGRIENYVTFGHEMLAYLDQQKKAHPELTEFLTKMEKFAGAIDAAVAPRKDNIKTPQYVVDLTNEFRRDLLDAEGKEAYDRCKKITEAIVVVGGNQDELVGECRLAVKVLRQQAGLAMAADPRTAEIAREIRRRTQIMLRNPTSYEAPRH